MVCTGCCATLDHIVTYLFKKVTNKGDQFSTIDQSLSILMTSQGKKSRSNNPSSGDNDSLVAVVKMRPEILQQMLQTVLNIIMFEDCRNQWSMSRPLLGLILLNEEYFQVGCSFPSVFHVCRHKAIAVAVLGFIPPTTTSYPNFN